MAAKKLTRVSPGIYKDASGKIVKSASGNVTKSTKAKNSKGANNNAGPQPLDISDPNAVTQAQQQENARAAQESGRLNNPNVQGVGANRTVTYDENGNPTVNVGLGEREQGMYDQALRGYQDPFSFDGLPDIPSDFSADRQKIEDQLYQRESSRLDEQYGRQAQEFEQSMANRGIPVGSQLYNKMQSEFERNKADAYSGARQNAIQTAGAEEQRLFGNAMQGRQQGIGERQYTRGLPLSELSGLMGLGMGVNSQFQSYQGQGVNPTDIAGISQGYYGLGQEAKLAREQMANNKKIAGSANPNDWLARMNAETQQRKDLLQFQSDLNNQNKPKSPGFGDYAGAAGASFLGSAANAFGQGLGNKITGWLS